MKKRFSKTIASVAVIAATAVQLSAISASASETSNEAGKYPRICITTKAGNGNELVKADGYVKASIKDDYIFYFDIILKIRIGLFIIQIVNFIIYLAFKLDL